MTTPRECRLCGANSDRHKIVSNRVFGGKPGQVFYRCDKCDAVYLFPPLTPEEEHSFYTLEFEKFMGSRSGEDAGWEAPKLHVEQNRSQILRRMVYLRPAIPDSGRILEFGCSSGFMLYPLRNNGYHCVGIEPSGVFSEFVRSNGIPCFDSIDALKSENSDDGMFDVIMHFFVLEHISNPVNFLKQQLALLKPGGKLIFEIPNVADPLLTLYKIDAFNDFYWSVAHHWYFSETSLRYLLDQIAVDYSILLDQRYDLSNHMIWARDSRPGGMGAFSAVSGGELEQIYKNNLIKSGHCDTLVAILTK
jgi:SAM-dependent methyltransferase